MKPNPKLQIWVIAVASLAGVQVAAAENPCEGHNLLSTPRAETSCQTILAKLLPSPDKKTHATVLPADISLNATPDMESRVVIRSANGDTLNSLDHSSPRGMNGYYVDHTQWSPDSKFFVYNLVSSGGHSPWSHPTMVYSVEHNRFASFSDLIGGGPVLSDAFQFEGAHVLIASTWKREGAIEDPVPVNVDLAAAFAKLKPN
jgi:hypothetical protein